MGQPAARIDLHLIPDQEEGERVDVDDLTDEAALERIGEVMEGWLWRRYGLASSHRPGLDEDGREARAVIEAVLEDARSNLSANL